MSVHGPVSDAAWWAATAANDDVLAFQTPAWRDVMVEAGYRDATRAYDVSGAVHVLPLMVRRRAGVETAASLPYGWGFGGPVGPRPSDVAAAEILADLGALRHLRVSLRAQPSLACILAAAAPRRTVIVPRRAHILDLSGGFAEVWAHRFRSTTRTCVRKAERSGLEVEVDTTGALVGTYYELYERSLLRWGGLSGEPGAVARWRGMRRDPRSKVMAVAQHLGESCQVWVARSGGVPAAAIIVVVQGTNASYWRGAMDENVAGPTRANDLLHRLAIEAACEAGRTRYHMGDTGQSASLARFKAGFGAEPQDYTELRLERLPVTAVDERLRRLARRGIGGLRRGSRRPS